MSEPCSSLVTYGKHTLRDCLLIHPASPLPRQPRPPSIALGHPRQGCHYWNEDPDMMRSCLRSVTPVRHTRMDHSNSLRFGIGDLPTNKQSKARGRKTPTGEQRTNRTPQVDFFGVFIIIQNSRVFLGRGLQKWERLREKNQFLRHLHIDSGGASLPCFIFWLLFLVSSFLSLSLSLTALSTQTPLLTKVSSH